MAKTKLEYKQAPLVERLQIELDDEKKKKLTNWINRKKSEIEIDRTQFAERNERYLFNWDDFITYTRKGPWLESSNLHLPLTAIMVKTYHARFYNIFTNEDTTQLIPRETSDEKFSAIIAKLRYWYLWDYINNYRGIRGFAREVFYDMVTTGFGIGMKDWIVQQRKTIVIEQNQADELQREMEDLQPQMDEMTKNTPELQTDEEMAQTRKDISPYKEVQRIITVFEGSRMRSLPWENCYFPNDIYESNNLDEPLCVLLDTEMSNSQIKLKAKQQEWDKEGVDQIIAEGKSQYTGSKAQEIKQIRSNLSGIESSIEHDDNKRIVEYCFCTYDIDDDGLDEELVVIKSDKGAILKATYLERISRMGRRPLYKFDCFSKPRQAYCRGVPEFMWPIQTEVDEMHNKRQDLLTLQTTPFGVYRATSSLKNQPIRIAPGKLLPVDDTADVRLLSWGSSASVFVNEQQLLWHYAERMTSVSALSQGMVPDQVGPTRSTSGVIALLKQMDKELKISVDQCADQWKKMEMMLLDDLDYRIDPMIKLRVLGPSIKDADALIRQYGKDSVHQILQINSSFDVSINVASAIHSEEVRRNDSQVILQILSSPSIAQQMGIVGPRALYKAFYDYLMSYGKDPEEYIDKPAMIDRPLTLFQEIQFCGQGEVPPMSMQDDHEAKAQQLISFMQEPEYQQAKSLGIYVANIDEMMGKTIKKHMMIAEMLRPKGLPNPSGFNNANQNETQAGVSPQQGGQNPNRTTSRPVDTGGPPPAEEEPTNAQEG